MLIYTAPERNDEDALVEMYETYLNSGRVIRDYIREGLENKDFVGVKCVDTETGKTVGILSARPGIQFTCPHPDLEKIIRERWGSEGAYTGDMLVVDPAYRGRGIARELAKQLRIGLLKKHASYFLQEQWLRHKDGKIPAKNPMMNVGEATLVTVDKNFYSNLGEVGLTCPDCGENCKCGAVVSVIEFHYPQDEEANDEKTRSNAPC